MRMGVFSMAIPFAMPVRRATYSPGPGRQTMDRNPVRPSTPEPGKGIPSTLLPAHRVERSPEARVQRTPEQQAEQDALARLVTQCMAGDQRAWHQMVTG